MTAKKQTTIIEKEVKVAEEEVKTPAKKSVAKKTPKKLSKEELMKKVSEEPKEEVVEQEVLLSEEEQQEVVEEPAKEKKPTKKVTPKKAKKEQPKMVAFPETLDIPKIGKLQKVAEEDFNKFKDLENLVVVTLWTKQTVRNYEPVCTPGVKTSDLFTLGQWSYDVQTPIYFKNNSPQLITVSNFTEACFVFGTPSAFELLNKPQLGDYRLDGDLVFELYQIVEPSTDEEEDKE